MTVYFTFGTFPQQRIHRAAMAAKCCSVRSVSETHGCHCHVQGIGPVASASGRLSCPVQLEVVLTVRKTFRSKVALHLCSEPASVAAQTATLSTFEAACAQGDLWKGTSKNKNLCRCLAISYSQKSDDPGHPRSVHHTVCANNWTFKTSPYNDDYFFKCCFIKLVPQGPKFWLQRKVACGCWLQNYG